MSRKKLLLAAAVCVIMTPLTLLTGMGDESPASLAVAFAGLPISVWMGLIIMAALVVGAWLSVEDDAGEPRP
jgi:hypothetical protein